MRILSIKNATKSIIALALCVICLGCGYYPASYYAKQSIGESVFVDIKISLSDPENSVVAKDALNYAIITRLQGNLTSRDEAQTIIYVDMTNIDMYSISDSRDGFSNFYRIVVRLKFRYTDKNGKINEFANTGIYDFPVDNSSTITDSKRSEAINQACIQAIDKFVAQVASRWR